MPRYPYTRFSLPLSRSFLQFKNAPLLKVGLQSESGAMVKCVAYIDTGAQVCLFNSDYARVLGIKDYKQVASDKDVLLLSGIGGKKPENRAYFHDLKLVVFGDEKHLTLDDALRVIETKIGFLETPIEFAGILGVYGFLDHFRFEANVPEHCFSLEPVF